MLEVWLIDRGYDCWCCLCVEHSGRPFDIPSAVPSHPPSSKPSLHPSNRPSDMPSVVPSRVPSLISHRSILVGDQRIGEYFYVCMLLSLIYYIRIYRVVSLDGYCCCALWLILRRMVVYVLMFVM